MEGRHPELVSGSVRYKEASIGQV